MSKTIQAIYKGGVIKPLEKLDLSENERVAVQIFRDKDQVRTRDRARKLSEVEEIEEVDISLPNADTYRENIKKAFEKVEKFSQSNSGFFSLSPVSMGKIASREIDLIISGEAVRKK